MSHILTLIGTTDRPSLTDETLRSVLAGIPKDHSAAGWLAQDRAVDVHISIPTASQADTVLGEIRNAVARRPLDWALQPAHSRRKRLLVADMESTIIEQEMLDELADYVGLRDKIAGITERAMRGELDFEAALNERVGLLAGLEASVLDDVAKRITYMPGARALIATMKANGAYCALVSGGFTVFTARVAAELGFDEHQANTLELADGKLTGRVVPPILGREAKLAALKRLCTTLGIEADSAICVGDGANDLAMLEAAGLGVAFHAKPKVREAAAAFPNGNGAIITHGDLTALLYLQGFTSAEIAR